MGNSAAETLAEIRGFLHAFAWVNHKTNHGYAFEISSVEPSDDLARDVDMHFCRLPPGSAVLLPCNDRRKTLFDTVKRWLLSYLDDPPSTGRLTDQSATFSLSSEFVRKEMIDPLIRRIESLGSIESAYGIQVETDEFYACDYTDLLLVTAGPLIFLHFDVCD